MDYDTSKTSGGTNMNLSPVKFQSLDVERLLKWYHTNKFTKRLLVTVHFESESSSSRPRLRAPSTNGRCTVTSVMK